MRDLNGAAEFHDYPFSQTAITYLLMPVVSLVGILLGIFLLTAGSAIVGALLILFGGCLVFLSAFGSLMCSSIAINDEGIAARNFGRTLRYIRWEDVTKIKKVRRWNAGSRSYENVFHVFDDDFPALRERLVNLRGPIVFSDKICKMSGLLNKINESARRYQFPLVTLDQEATREIVTQKKARPLGQTVPKADETKVTEF
jgi:ABC-type multidrug transport system fused ATPase/permease subunit